MGARLADEGYLTPKGNRNWWPAQVQQLLAGAYDAYYKKASSSKVRQSRAGGVAAEGVAA
jgi:hypothetical protein